MEKKENKQDTFFLVFFVQRQHFLSCYWTMQSPALLHHDPSLAYLEQYQLGFQQFSVLFSLLEPWGFCTTKSTLSLWVFRLIDENQDGLVNFKEFCWAIGRFPRCTIFYSTSAAADLITSAAYCTFLLLQTLCAVALSQISWNSSSSCTCHQVSNEHGTKSAAANVNLTFSCDNLTPNPLCCCYLAAFLCNCIFGLNFWPISFTTYLQWLSTPTGSKFTRCKCLAYRIL